MKTQPPITSGTVRYVLVEVVVEDTEFGDTEETLAAVTQHIQKAVQTIEWWRTRSIKGDFLAATYPNRFEVSDITTGTIADIYDTVSDEWHDIIDNLNPEDYQ